MTTGTQKEPVGRPYADGYHYRYQLTRYCDNTSLNRVLFVMLNPSTADDEVDDPTIRRCIGFARRWGFMHLMVGNLFAVRSTDPRRLLTTPEPVGKENDRNLLEMAGLAHRIVYAWGNWGHHPKLRYRQHEVRNLLWAERARVPAARTPMAIGTTKLGAPQHPGRIAYDTPLKVWH